MDTQDMITETIHSATCIVTEKNKSSIFSRMAMNYKKNFQLAISGCIIGTVAGYFLGGGGTVIFFGVVIIIISLIMRYLWVDSVIKYEINYSIVGSKIIDLKIMKEDKSRTIDIPPNQIFRLDHSPRGHIIRIKIPDKEILIIIQELYYMQEDKLVNLLRKNDPYLNPGAQLKPSEIVSEKEIYIAKRTTTMNILVSIFGLAVGIYSILQFFNAFEPNWWNYTCMGACAPLGIIIFLLFIGMQIKPLKVLITPTGIIIKSLILKRKITFASMKKIIIESTVNPLNPSESMIQDMKAITGDTKPVNLFNLNAFADGEHILAIVMNHVQEPVEWKEI